MRIVPGLLVAALVTFLTACAGPAQEALQRAERADADAARADESPPAPSPASRCDELLPEGEVAELAGEDLGPSVFPPRGSTRPWRRGRA